MRPISVRRPSRALVNGSAVGLHVPCPISRKRYDVIVAKNFIQNVFKLLTNLPKFIIHERKNWCKPSGIQNTD
jgi:hypothetical protein